MAETSIIDPELALRIIREDRNPIAYDTETSGLSVKDFVCGYVVTNNEYSIYVPLRHQAGGNIPTIVASEAKGAYLGSTDFEVELAAAFKDRGRYGYRTIGHNLGFDLRASARHGVILMSPLEDTMINELLVNDIASGFGLDDCSIRHGVTPKLGAELYKAIADRFGGLPDRKQMANFWRMPGDDPRVLDYATGDGVSTLELWEAQQHILDRDELRVPWKLECDLLPYVARMHTRGMKVDMGHVPQLMKDINEAIAEEKKKFPLGFNARSSNECEKLYRSQGYSDADFSRTAPTAANPNGQISFTEKWLETNDLGKAIIAVRQLENCVSKFVTPMTETHNVDGRLYPILNQSKSDDFGVAGSRFSCSDPNMQAVTKRNKKIGKIVRRLIVPDTGMLIEEADAKQQEPRLFTHYSQEPALLHGYNTGTMDIHDVADSFFKIGRDKAKRLGLGILTGMQQRALAGHMRWTLAEAKAAKNAFLDDVFPNIKQFQADAASVFAKRGYVKSILGRRAYLDDKRFAYRAVSRIIQNSGGDHNKTCLLRACQYEDVYPDKIQMLMVIHDSNLWQRDPGHDTTELIRILENVPYEPEFSLSVPIPFEVGSGTNWAEASYGK